jgi:hypothetical protein
MASASVPGMHGWGNLYHSSGALRPSPSHRGGLRAPFLCSCRVANIVATNLFLPLYGGCSAVRLTSSSLYTR